MAHEMANSSDTERHESLVDVIRESWEWRGIEPVEVVGENDFGNLIIKDASEKYWRLRPEDCCCDVIATNLAALSQLLIDKDFLNDWSMTSLVSLANHKYGLLPEGRKYCLKIPSVLGGGYCESNLATAPLVELVRISGTIARRIHDLADGSKVKLQVVE